MEILGELEQDGRGHTGSFGYMTHSGNMDINILIRSMLRENDQLFFRAGGGLLQIQFQKMKLLKQRQKPMEC